MHSQRVLSTPESKAVRIITKFLRDGEASSAALRKQLHELGTSVTPGLRSCCAFDSISSIISLSDTSLLKTALVSMFERANSKGASVVSAVSSATSSDAAIPENWGTAAALQIRVSSNQSDSSRLTDGDENSFWQSNGSCPHWIKLYMDEIKLSRIGIIISSQDGSYCPEGVRFLVGSDENSAVDLGLQRVQVSGTKAVVVEIEKDDPFEFIFIKIESNQQGGCDTRVRGVFVESRGSSKSSVWEERGKARIHQARHYIEVARGTNEPELRIRFNRVTKSLFDIVRKDFCNPVCFSALEMLTMRMDRADLDFLAARATDEFFSDIWIQIEAHISRTSQQQSFELEQEFVHNLAAFGRFLVCTLEQVSRLGTEVNPLIRKSVVEAALSAISRAYKLVTASPATESRSHLEQLAGLVISSVDARSTSSTVSDSFSKSYFEWEKLLFSLASSQIQEKIRLTALQLMLSLALIKKPEGSDITQLIRSLLNVIWKSSPEFAVLSDDDADFAPNLLVRSKAISTIEFLLRADWARKQVTNSLLESFRQYGLNREFMPMIFFFGGRIDVQNRSWNGELDQAIGDDVYSRDIVSLIVKHSETVLSKLRNLKQASDMDELAAIVTSARTVKCIWEHLPSLQESIASSSLISDLVQLALEPCRVPYSCVSVTTGSGGLGSWTWGPCEPNNIVIADSGLTAKNRSGSSPDYSCALGSEAFDQGVHTWVIEVQNVSALWLGIARGVQEGGGLGSSPGQHGEYQLYFGSGGGWGHRGAAPSVQTISSATAFSSGQKVKFVLDVSAKSLVVSVDSEVKYICDDVDCSGGVVPYMCSDYTESVTVVERFSSRGKQPDLNLDMLVTKTNSLMPRLKDSSSRGSNNLQSILSDLGLTSEEIITSTMQKLLDAGITADDLGSPSITSDKLKAAGVVLGPRKAILERRDKLIACEKYRPRLVEARALSRMCEPPIPLSACMKAIASVAPDEKLDLAELAKNLKQTLSFDDDTLAKYDMLQLGVDSETFIRNGSPSPPARIGGSRPETKAVKGWATCGSIPHLLVDVERSILTLTSRFVVHHLLECGGIRGMGAEKFEVLLMRSFESIEHPRPRVATADLSEDEAFRVLVRSALGWIGTAAEEEVEKMKGLYFGALSRYISGQVNQLKSGGQSSGTQDSPQSEEDSVQSGIGFALVILMAFIEADHEVLDLTEALAKCLILSSADTAVNLLNAIGTLVGAVKEKSRFKVGQEMRKALLVLRNACVSMIKNEQRKIRSGFTNSSYLQGMVDSISYLESVSPSCFNKDGNLVWSDSSEVKVRLIFIIPDP